MLYVTILFGTDITPRFPTNWHMRGGAPSLLFEHMRSVFGLKASFEFQATLVPRWELIDNMRYVTLLFGTDITPCVPTNWPVCGNVP